MRWRTRVPRPSANFSYLRDGRRPSGFNENVRTARVQVGRPTIYHAASPTPFPPVCVPGRVIGENNSMTSSFGSDAGRWPNRFNRSENRPSRTTRTTFRESFVRSRGLLSGVSGDGAQRFEIRFYRTEIQFNFDFSTFTRVFGPDEPFYFFFFFPSPISRSLRFTRFFRVNPWRR